ncbi:hypothetical protein SLS55_009595 [Diplodia seriata]|uniref:DUF7580 domain-containing protein n=1 Tax=Diplodia seriata TaxID=420778 RepID=A0ABR3C374_9PEZI
MLRLTLQKLLLPLVPDDKSQALDDLLNDPVGPLWNDPSLIEKLKERLGFTFDQYFEIIEALKESLEELITLLGMTKEHFQTILHRNGTIEERKTRILARIEFEYVRLKISTSSAERNETLEKVERYNEQLSKLLQGCDEVSAMEKSQVARKGNDRLDPKLTDFHRHADQLYTMLSKAWRCTSMASGPKKRVGFVDPPGNSVSVCSRSSPPAPQRPPVDDEITNLCSFMASSTLTYFGVLRHQHEEYSVYPALTPQAATDPRDTVTLRSLLDKSLGISLSRKQRFFIGLTLASSYLQLHSTQWLKSQWDKSDILFPRHGSTVAVEEPFVSRGLSTGVLDGSMPTNSHGIVSLGIMLLELAFNMTLEEFDRDGRYVSPEGKRDAQLTWLAAVNWSNSAAEDAGIDFADAVKWCLQGQLVAVHDKEWRKELVANVLEPLQRFYGVFERIAKE